MLPRVRSLGSTRAGVLAEQQIKIGTVADLIEALDYCIEQQLGSFPPEGTDTATLTPQVTPEGFFVPLFSGAGPDPSAVDYCAPGVAVISGLPQLDPARTGAGIPDVAVALGVAPWGVYPPLAMPYPAPAPSPRPR